ncbi:acetylxylan esterase [Streptococcus suis]|nr:acetylxylan esterase [Streptococcus suis]HEL1672617.1 acetylxylan esterase [Streptococcus suis]
MIETMSLEQMKQYYRRQEKPDDIDKFWSDAIASVEHPISYELFERDCTTDAIKTYELYFEGTDFSKVYAKCLFPKTDKKIPVIFHFHGYQGQSREWSELLKFVAVGYGVIAMDVRGQAGKSQDFGRFEGTTAKGQVIRGMIEGPSKLFFKDVYLDVYRLVEIVSTFDFVESTHLFAYGASQGGALALVAVALNPKISKVMTVYPFLSDFKGVLELGNNSEAYDELFRYFKFTDPFHETEEDILHTLSYIDVKNLAHRISCPVGFVTGLEDEVCPPSTQFAIFNRLNCEKNMQIVPEYGHEQFFVKVNDYIFEWLLGIRL